MTPKATDDLALAPEIAEAAAEIRRRWADDDHIIRRSAAAYIAPPALQSEARRAARALVSLRRIARLTPFESTPVPEPEPTARPAKTASDIGEFIRQHVGDLLGCDRAGDPTTACAKGGVGG